jgi:aspartate-semialdehyde dehydrogenase
MPPIVVMSENSRPQPRLDADLGDGMAVSVGRLRPCPVMHCRFVALGHNTVRGAAGAAILNAELMHAEGMLA